MRARGTQAARSSQTQSAGFAARSGGILEFIEQDAEAWREVERFANLPDDAVSQKDVARLFAALAKAEAAWRMQQVREPRP